MAVKANSTPRAKGGRKPAASPSITSPQPAKPAAEAKPAEPAKVTQPAPAAKVEPVVSKPVADAKPAAPAPVAQPVAKPVVAEKPVEAKVELVKAPEVKAPEKPVAVKPPVAKPVAEKAPVAQVAAPAAPVKKPSTVAAPAAPTPVAKAPIAEKPAPAAAPKIEAPVAKAPAAQPASPAQPALAEPTPAKSTAKPKEPAMTTLPTFDMPEAFKTAFADFQEKAKAAYEKSTVSAADYSEFAKGNIEALVEAGKIFTAGLQELGTALVADSREAFETMTAEVKTLAAAKTPTDFVQIQSDLLKKHFDKSVAFASKQSEAALKLASETVAPISGRVSLAVEKVKAAA